MDIQTKIPEQLIVEMSHGIVVAGQSARDPLGFIRQFKELLEKNSRDPLLQEVLLRLPEDLFVPLAEAVSKSDDPKDWEQFVKLYEEVRDCIEQCTTEAPILARYKREAKIIKEQVRAVQTQIANEHHTKESEVRSAYKQLVEERIKVAKKDPNLKKLLKYALFSLIVAGWSILYLIWPKSNGEPPGWLLAPYIPIVLIGVSIGFAWGGLIGAVIGLIVGALAGAVVAVLGWLLLIPSVYFAWRYHMEIDERSQLTNEEKQAYETSLETMQRYYQNLMKAETARAKLSVIATRLEKLGG
ncbi:hypothetical protein [Thermoflexus sp.]|uniref:hypothetical protein n=1 Tax=Thermoflexus sp. TaxID=1969742 RepID=UPI0035E43D09